MSNGLTRRTSLGALAGAAAGVGAALPAGKAAAADLDPRHVAHRNRLFGRAPAQGPVLLLEEGREGVFQWQAGDFTEAVRADPRQAIHVASSGDPAGARGVWKRAVEGGVHLVWFGAKFDVDRSPSIADATDDSDAWEAALAFLGFIGGGTLHLPHGVSKVTAQIDIPVDVPIRIVGTGMHKVYPGNLTVGQSLPSTVFPVHTGRAAFRFLAAANGQGSFTAENFNVSGLISSGTLPDCAFGWETQGGFLYGFTFRQVGVYNFRKAGNVGAAFEAYRESGTAGAVGSVLIENCTINHNNWIARTLDDTHINGFRFVYNKAGQNGYLPGNGGINISGHDVAINNNIIEATRDAVRCHGAFTDIEVKGNYFEYNVGRACIELESARGPFTIGPNNYAVLNYASASEDAGAVAKLAQKVIISATGLGTCIDPYFPNGTNKMAPPLIGTIALNSLSQNPAGSHFLRADRFEGAGYNVEPDVLAIVREPVTIQHRDTNPQTGLAMPVQGYATSGSDLLGYNSGALAGGVGQWVVFSWPMRRISSAGASLAPYLTLLPNDDYNLRHDIPLYAFQHTFRTGEWSLVTAAIPLTVDMASLYVNIYPYGINPPAGLECRFTRPISYVVDDVNKIAPYFDNNLVSAVSAAPTAGTWNSGDTLRNTAGGFFVCTASGTPGAWGTITPA